MQEAVLKMCCSEQPHVETAGCIKIPGLCYEQPNAWKKETPVDKHAKRVWVASLKVQYLQAKK
jgi:hypothetical protein